MSFYVIYDSKYGNTKLVAESILDGLKQTGEIDAAIGNVKDIDLKALIGYDALIIGSPNHMGKPSRTMIKFVNSLSNLPIDAKWAAAFDTYFYRQRYFEKAMKKLERHINKRLPNLELITPGLSVKVKGVNGPIEDGQLPKAKEFGEKIAAQLTGAKHKKN